MVTAGTRCRSTSQSVAAVAAFTAQLVDVLLGPRGDHHLGWLDSMTRSSVSAISYGDPHRRRYSAPVAVRHYEATTEAWGL